MIPNLTWTRRLVAAQIMMFVVGFSMTLPRAGQIVSVPIPTSSGPGMGFVNIALIVTPTPNNDDVPGALPDNDIIVPQKRFDSVGFIDTEFTVSTTSGVTEYQVVEGVDNNTGINWSAYTILLGFGTGPPSPKWAASVMGWILIQDLREEITRPRRRGLFQSFLARTKTSSCTPEEFKVWVATISFASMSRT